MLIGLGNLGACGCGGMCGGMCGGNCPGAAQAAAPPPPPTAPINLFSLGRFQYAAPFAGTSAAVTWGQPASWGQPVMMAPTVALPPTPGVLYASDADRFKQECTGSIRSRVGLAYTTLRCCGPTGTCGPAVRFDTSTGARLGF